MCWMFAVYFFLLSPRCPASNANSILQEPKVATAEEEESVNITCNFNHPNILGLYLRRKFVKDMEVFYSAGHRKDKRVHYEYKGRIEYFELQNTVIIMLQKLQQNDSDKYICDGAVLINQNPVQVQGHGTILVVTAKKLIKCSSSFWMWYVFLVVTLLLATALGYFILSHVDAKKYCQKKKGREAQNMVYEDMTYSLRRNTMANQYEC
ncbi:uncharacterized protein LOC129328923 [Eublepharis macularius]|uniref:Uncharacterized protein LOC129328923 n=1 Tax=Eublepharis macularius TaxID=481883 RepID=A0AA97KYY8_EUBMA|nr:uncharacterized protein LOC129328923 [Eublepharis macularius]